MLIKRFKNKITDANGVYGDKTIENYKYMESLIRRYLSLLATKQRNKTHTANTALTIQSDVTSYVNTDGTYVMHTCIFHSLNSDEDLTRSEFINGIDEEEEPTETITIHGVVADSSTYEAIEGVLVSDITDSSTDSSTYTDSDGMFTIEIPSWSRTLSFEHDDYVSITKSASYFTEVGSTASIAYMDEVEEPEPVRVRMYGVVKDSSTGEVISSASIYNRFGTEVIATTGTDGTFNVIVQGTYVPTYRVEKTDYETAYFTSLDLSVTESTPGVINMDPEEEEPTVTTTLYGKVIDASTSSALYQAVARYVSASTNVSDDTERESLLSAADSSLTPTSTPVYSTTTDENGEFSLTVEGESSTVSEGQIWISKTDYTTKKISAANFLSIYPLYEVSLSPKTTTLKIQGIIADSGTHEGIADATVQIYDSGSETFQALTDTEGKFTGFRINSWDDQLKITATGYVTTYEDADYFTTSGSTTFNTLEIAASPV